MLSFSRNDELELCRVEYVGPYEHPDRPGPPDALHKICGHAGLDASGRVVVGRAALQLDLNFTIKSLLIF